MLIFSSIIYYSVYDYSIRETFQFSTLLMNPIWDKIYYIWELHKPDFLKTYFYDTGATCKCETADLKSPVLTSYGREDFLDSYLIQVSWFPRRAFQEGFAWDHIYLDSLIRRPASPQSPLFHLQRSFCHWIPGKITELPRLTAFIIKPLSTNTRNELIMKYPEIMKWRDDPVRNMNPFKGPMAWKIFRLTLWGFLTLIWVPLACLSSPSG